MFYSRPSIEPFGWDLLALPSPNGSKNFDGLTSDMRPVDFRFSGGWLIVEVGPPHARPDGDDMEEVLSIQIAPFGVMDISPEQICDMLGLTVNGRRVEAPILPAGARGFDWSGRTTYWRSTHMLESGADARILLQKMVDAFPGAVLIQPEWGSHARVRCRQIRFLMSTDELATVAVVYEKHMLDALLAAEEVSWEEFEKGFGYAIEFIRGDHSGEDVTGERPIYSRTSALGLKYRTIHHRRYRVETRFPTADMRAQAISKTLLSILDEHFCRGLQIVDLQTGARLEDLPDEEDTRSYSRALRDACLSDPNGYLFVGAQGSYEKPVYFGARPAG